MRFHDNSTHEALNLKPKLEVRVHGSQGNWHAKLTFVSGVDDCSLKPEI